MYIGDVCYGVHTMNVWKVVVQNKNSQLIVMIDYFKIRLAHIPGIHYCNHSRRFGKFSFDSPQTLHIAK